MNCIRGNLHELNTWQPEWTVHVATSMNRTRGNPLHELNTWQPAWTSRGNLQCWQDFLKFVLQRFGGFSPCMLFSRFLLLVWFLSLFCNDMNHTAVLKRSSLFWQISWLVAAAPGPPPTLWNQRMRRTCWIVGFSAHRFTSSCTRIFRLAS
jgi:hypothetical protein